MKYANFVSAIIVMILFSNLSIGFAVAKTSNPGIVFLGTYEKVESATGEHCSGYSIDLWKHNNVLFGLLHHHRGLCGDPPCGVLRDLEYKLETGGVRFKADTGESKFSFSGSLKNNSLTGTLTKRWPETNLNAKEIVQWPKHRDEYLAEKINSLEEWHEFYDAIPRCHAVKTYMLNK